MNFAFYIILYGNGVEPYFIYVKIYKIYPTIFKLIIEVYAMNSYYLLMATCIYI